MAAQKALINRIVDNFNPRAWNSEQLFDFALGESRYRKNSSGAPHRSPGHGEVQNAPRLRTVVRAVHVLEHIVHRHHIRAGKRSRQPEQMRNMGDVASQAMEYCTTFKKTFERIVGLEQGNGLEIGRKRTN